MRGPNSWVILTLVAGLLLLGRLEILPRAEAARANDSPTASQNVDPSKEIKEDHLGDIFESERNEESGDNYYEDDEEGDQEEVEETHANPLAELDESHGRHVSHRTSHGEACGTGFARCRNGRCYLLRRKCDGVLDCTDGSDEYNCRPRRPLPPDTFTTPSNTFDPFDSNTTPYHVHTPPSRVTTRPFYSATGGMASSTSYSPSGNHYATSDGQDYRSTTRFEAFYRPTTTRSPVPTTLGVRSYPPESNSQDLYANRGHPGLFSDYTRPTRYPFANTSYYYPISSKPYFPGPGPRYPTLEPVSARRSHPSSVVTYQTPTDNLYRPTRYPTSRIYTETVTSSYSPIPERWRPPQVVTETRLPATPAGPDGRRQTVTTAEPTTTRAALATIMTTTTHAPFVVRECLRRKEFRCASGQCIPRWQICDYVTDCYDGSDERHCKPCDDRIHYTCVNGQCINKGLVCDGNNDCRDKSDEATCSKTFCSPDEFRCGDGSCIPNRAQCDGRKDCRDGTDEGPHCMRQSAVSNRTVTNHSGAAGNAESSACASNEFRCDDGYCLNESRRCNRVIDCHHGEDELGCEADRGCAATEFKCPQDGLCIRQNQLCDGVLDCIGGNDEMNCGNHHRVNPAHSFSHPKDADRAHYPKHPNRPDENSDERCREHDRRWRQEMERRRIEEQQRRLEQQQYEKEMIRRRAEDARRNREHWELKERQQEEEERQRQKEETAKKVDDAVKWIEDALSEAGNVVEAGVGSSRQGQCLPGEFACRTHDQCVAAGRRCDRRHDCFDGSDEANCCTSGEFQCGDGSCVRAQNRCDGRRDCSDGADEIDCPDQKLCGASKFHCGDGQCIKDILRCDGYYDCNNFADEQNCEFHDCGPAQFKCLSGLCIARDEFCDGIPQCPDRSDEIDCWRCQPTQFTCTNGQCIERGHRCDGKPHCADGSDENGCSVSDIDVRVYPSFQNETAGHNVVIRCRDEGPRRLKVHWARADGRPLKSGHSDHRGRLTLPRVTEDDAGVYLCVPLSVDGQELRPSQKSATLVVTAPISKASKGNLATGYWTISSTSTNAATVEYKKARRISRNSASVSEEPNRPILVRPNGGGDTALAGSGGGASATSEGTTPTGLDVSEGCNRDEAACHSGQCVLRKYLCDGDYDCEDGSDELNCAQQSECEPNEFECANRRCVSKTFWCDGDDDCGDRTDESDCKTVVVGSACSQREYQCSSQDQCIPRSFQCDQEFDCQDKSDEIGCGPPIIITPPPKVVTASEGDTVNVSCGAIGNPEPFISWRKNWGHIPSPPRVTTTSDRGVGILTIREVSQSDQGAWTCEAMNVRKNVLAVPDTILVVKARGICQNGQFNEEAKSSKECLNCFCFGASTSCRSSNMYRVALNSSLLSAHVFERSNHGSYKDVSNNYSPMHKAVVQTGDEYSIDGTLIEKLAGSHQLYWSISGDLLGPRVASYGGYLKYSIKFKSGMQEERLSDDFADVVMRGNGLEIFYRSGIHYLPDQEYKINMQIIEHRSHDGSMDDTHEYDSCRQGAWLRPSHSGQSGGHHGGRGALREDIMTVLADLNGIYIRAGYTIELLQASIRKVELDSASYSNPQGVIAVLVEQCTCPQGYVGHSCEQCAAGFVRRQSGQFLGSCVQGVIPCACNGHSNTCDQTTGKCLNCQHNTDGVHCEKCKRGFYGQATRGTAFDCRPCPCPPITVPPHMLTSRFTGYPAEWFAPSCQLDADGEVTCTACPIGYEGRRCQKCAHGYERSDLGNTCRLSECDVDQFQCGGGSCIMRRQQCDGRYDCEDFSDEHGCACTLNQYKCRDGVCIDARARCDGKADCLDMSDEQQCGTFRCNSAGSLSADPSPSTGLCPCKPLVTGTACDTCRTNSFFLHADAPLGCVQCFCMGITSSCTSSNYYREQEILRFTTSTEDVRITDQHRSTTSDSGLKAETTRRELVFSEASVANYSYARGSSDVAYWQLPERFLGRKTLAYGGELRVKLRYEGGGIYRDQEPDIILVGTRATLQHRFADKLSGMFAQQLTVRMFESSFVKADGLPSRREDFMLVLANLQAILIKATYVDDTELAALVEVSLDIAVPSNTGQALALSVEQCRCPRGYRGLSCEACERGFTRSASGSFLGLCEPCFCNGHSSDCDPESGVCRDCQHHTTGDFCDECAPGFVGDATAGTSSDCTDISEPSCQCDTRGSISEDCDISEQCACKEYVEGKNCQRCKEGYFQLEAGNPHGCTPCFCFEVTEKCTSSTFYRAEIFMALADLDDPFQHHFQLTDRLQMQQITEGIVVNPSLNSVSFASFSSQETLFWSLPEQFLGNKLASYGGYLSFSQHYTAETEGEPFNDADIQITGNGMTLFYILHPPPSPAEQRSYRVPLRELDWRHFDPETSLSSEASRHDLLRVLANIEVLLIRATFSSRMLLTSLSSVNMSTAVPHATDSPDGIVAHEVEQCTCPPGYAGLSCEECAPGYLRDLSVPHAIRCSRCHCNGHSESCDPKTGQCMRCRHNTAGGHCDRCKQGFYGDATVGTPEDCKPCPCPHMQASNQFSKTCFLDTDGQATCNACPIGYSGRNCETCSTGYIGNPLRLGDHCVKHANNDTTNPLSFVRVQVHEPKTLRVAPGATAVLRCNAYGRSNVPVSVFWSRERGLPLPARATDASGLLTIVDTRLDDNGTYMCSVALPGFGPQPHILGPTLPMFPNPHSTDTLLSNPALSDSAFLIVEGLETRIGPRVRIDPQFLKVSAGQPVTFRCIASGHPVPELRWEKAGNGLLSPDSTFVDGSFRIGSARGSDQAEYFCLATNVAGSHRARAVLFVRGDDIGATQAPQVTVSPSAVEVLPGENIWLKCAPSGHPAPQLTWEFEHGVLPHNTQLVSGKLLIYNVQEHNRGNYTCTAHNKYGSASVDSVISIITNRTSPIVHIEPERQTVREGEDARLRCAARAQPSAYLTWTRIGANLTFRHLSLEDELIIEKVEVSDRGMYVCTAENREGSAQATSLLEVDRRAAPEVDIYPGGYMDPVEEGSPVLLQCRVLSGVPAPRLQWARADGAPLSSGADLSVEGVLRFNRFTAAEVGTYTCTAENPLGIMVASRQLALRGVPSLRIVQRSPYTVRTGDPIRLDCLAMSVGADGLLLGLSQSATTSGHMLRWSKQGQAITSYSSQDVHGSTRSLIIQRVAPSDAGHYVCSCCTLPKGQQSQGELPEGVEPRERNVVEESVLVIVQSATSGVLELLVDDEVISARLGASVELRCRLSGSEDSDATVSQPLRLEWNKLDGRPLAPDGERVTLSPDGGGVYISSTVEDDAGLYECRALQGEHLLFSRSTKLSIVGVYARGPPRISVNPSEQSVQPGEDARLSCMAWGDPPVALHWSRDSGHFLPVTARVRGQGHTLELRGVRRNDAGRYRCTAVNAAGRASAASMLLVSKAGQPRSGRRGEETALVGNTVELRCPSSGSVERHVEWEVSPNESNTGGSSTLTTLPANSKVHRGTLRFTNVTLRDAGRYSCTIKTKEGQILGKDYVVLNVREPNSLEVSVRASKEVILPGDTVDLLCHVAGAHQRPRILWSRLGASFLPDNVIAAGSMLTINRVRSENGGVYRCLVENSEGSFHGDYVFTIQIDVKHVKVRGSFEIICNSSLDQPVSYTWTKLPSGKLPSKARTRNELLVVADAAPSDAGTYICIARNENYRLEVPTHVVVTGALPRFVQAPRSYIRLPAIPDAYKRFDIELRFRADKLDGLLLYNGNEGHVDTADFISLGLVNGYIEFRFDIGSGPGLLRSPFPITTDKWHLVRFGRQLREGHLQIDSGPEIRGNSRGPMTGLDLRAPLYLGGVPDFRNISKANGFTSGFIGCISELVVGVRQIALQGTGTEFSEGVTECDTCALNPCLNNGVCQPAPTPAGYSCLCIPGFTGDTCLHTGESCYPGVCGEGMCVNRPRGGFDCFCPFGRVGLRCEQSVTIVEPSFQGDDSSYIAYRLPARHKDKFNVSLRIRPRNVARDSIVLYSAQNADGHGDFVALAIRNATLEFRFNTGSGVTIIKSKETLLPNGWVPVEISTMAKSGQLVVRGTRYAGTSKGHTKGLDLGLPLYVGGLLRDKVRLHPDVAAPSQLAGFEGCIAHVKVNGASLDLTSSVESSANVEDCGGRAPCHINPCFNGGICRERGAGSQDYECICRSGFEGPNCERGDSVCQREEPCANGALCRPLNASEFVCACPKGYTGRRCDQIADFHQSAQFAGDGWLQLDRSHLSHKDEETVKLSFSTTERDGILLFHGPKPEDTDAKLSDYLALVIADGFLMYTYDMGSGAAVIRSDVRVDDGELHTAQLWRREREGRLNVDGVDFSGSSAGSLVMLNTEGDIYLGGVPEPRKMTAGRFENNFRGCVHNVHIRDSQVLDLFDISVSSINVAECGQGALSQQQQQQQQHSPSSQVSSLQLE
ncbi:basement membrane-specific heparan sulfate proteoglycan core protein-like isoform X5 [Varroa destructor]|uniref:Basement membrane-specific heparan sulfate proteoglycan core protein n=1 Tax=Varroa destructor TaxID=109461 RepID=A0A7M7KRF9_VARDE|nr:basement membrane-specific heparan sulfate proteoglycan core protein-like isoform X5 [Varroa destructor]